MKKNVIVVVIVNIVTFAPFSQDKDGSYQSVAQNGGLSNVSAPIQLWLLSLT
jgi:hypothetical protein